MATRPLVLQHTRMNMWRIMFEGGGEVPDILKGEWNNKGQAQVIIDQYSAKKSDGKSSGNKRVQHVRKRTDNRSIATDVS